MHRTRASGAAGSRSTRRTRPAHERLAGTDRAPINRLPRNWGILLLRTARHRRASLRLAGHRFRLCLRQPRHQIRARRHYRTRDGLSGERPRRLRLLRLLRRLRPRLARLLSSSGRWLLLLLRWLYCGTRRLRPYNRLPGLNRPRRARNNDRRRRNGPAGQRLPRTSQNLTWTRRSGARLLWRCGRNRLGSRSLRLSRSSPLLWLLCLNGRRQLLRLSRRLRARNRRLNNCRRPASRSGCNLCSGRTDRGWRSRRLTRAGCGNRWLKRSMTAEQRRTHGYGRPRGRNHFDGRGRGWLFRSPLFFFLFLRCGRRFLLRSRFDLGSRLDLFLLFFFLLCLLFGRRRHSLFLRGFGAGRLVAVTVDAKVLLDVLSDVLVNRAGVSLLLGHTELRQQFEYLVGFNFQLPRQLVDSNLLHIENCQASRTDSGRAPSRTTFHTYPARRLSLVLTGLRRANPSPLS